MDQMGVGVVGTDRQDVQNGQALEHVAAEEVGTRDETEDVGAVEDGDEDIEDDEDDEQQEEEEEEDSGAEDDDLDMDEAKTALCEALDAIEGTGSFAVFGTIPGLADPHLTIDEGRAIMLPLLEQDARRIVAASHQAPVGRGEETIIDPAVRRTWELNHDQFTIHNPSFQQSVGHILQACRNGLGLGDDYVFEAQLYKLLLYEQGALFKPHTEYVLSKMNSVAKLTALNSTEKTPGMFATLMICLPSAHRGGCLELSHHGIAKQFQTSHQQPSYGAWYSDVTHEVKEVQSGYRLVLTYNLVQRMPNHNVSASGFGLRHAPVNKALRQ